MQNNNVSEVQSLMQMCTNNTITITNQTHEPIIKKAELVVGLANKVVISTEESVKIEKCFDTIISTLNKNTNICLEVTKTVNVQSKIAKQVRFYSSKQKKQKTSNLFNTPVNEVATIKAGLYNESESVLHIHTDFHHTYE